MSEEKPLEELPADIKVALEAERSRPDLPAITRSQLIGRIEGSAEFQQATRTKYVGASRGGANDVLSAVKTRTGLILFLAGTLWGLVLGAAIASYLLIPAAQGQVHPSSK